MTNTSIQAQSCWLDCDPGHDDSFAILLASFSKNINIIGISTVSGNQTIEKTHLNALNVLNLIGNVKREQESLAYPLIKGTQILVLFFILENNFK